MLTSAKHIQERVTIKTRGNGVHRDNIPWGSAASLFSAMLYGERASNQKTPIDPETEKIKVGIYSDRKERKCFSIWKYLKRMDNEREEEFRRALKIKISGFLQRDAERRIAARDPGPSHTNGMVPVVCLSSPHPPP